MEALQPQAQPAAEYVRQAGKVAEIGPPAGSCRRSITEKIACCAARSGSATRTIHSAAATAAPTGKAQEVVELSGCGTTASTR